MKKLLILFVISSLTVLLAACAGQAPSAPSPAAITNTTAPTLAPQVNAPTLEPPAELYATITDQQGAVIVDVTPINLADPGDTLLFEVSMNTHSIDLSMDLAQLAVLTTDSGKKLQATLWDAPRGGHHVSGTLGFPATLEGFAVLESAKSVTITISGVDAAARTFNWLIGD